MVKKKMPEILSNSGQSWSCNCLNVVGLPARWWPWCTPSDMLPITREFVGWAYKSGDEPNANAPLY
jgi:hypothetical protein